MIPRFLAAQFAADIRARGDGYAALGRVRITSCENGVLLATVQGTRRYEVMLVHARQELLLDCTCPFAQEYGPCKHQWAVVNVADATGYLPSLVAGARATIFGHPPARGGELPPFVTRVEAPPGVAPAAAVSSPRPPRAPGWQRVLGQARHAPPPAPPRKPWPAADRLAFIIDLEATRSAAGLVVRLATMRPGPDGHPLPPRMLRGRFDSFEPPQHPTDRLALQLLRGTARMNAWHDADSTSAAGFVIEGDAAPTIMPLLHEDGRLWVRGQPEDNHPRGPIGWDEGPPWVPRIRVVRDGPAMRMAGELARPGAAIPLEDPPLLLSTGLVVLHDAVARFDHQGHFALVAALRNAGPQHLAEDELPELLARLHELPRIPEVELPEGVSVSMSAPHPVPVLDIEVRSATPWGAPRTHLRTSFDYDGVVVAGNDDGAVAFDRTRLRVMRRDPAFERAARERLVLLGARQELDAHRGPVQLTIAASRVEDLVATLLGEGWRVLASGVRQRHPTGVRPRIVSGTDWFGLEGSLDFGDATAELPAVLRAIASGRRTVELSDGSEGRVTAEWRARLAPLLAAASLGDGAGRFRSSQAALLDALVATMPVVEGDEAFQQAREALRAFAGIEPAPEPPGFGGTLRGYQREGLGWFLFLQRFGLGGCLADDMGLGKTVQVLALLASRQGEGAGPSLVVVPRSLVFNWKAEAARFAPSLRVLDHTGVQRDLDGIAGADLVLTTYGTLRRDAPRLREVGFDYVILDEAQAIKNATTASSKAVRLLRARHRLALTGTPIENRLEELWSLVEFLNPGLLGTATVFRRLARASAPGRPRASDEGGTGDGPGDGTRALLARALKPIILRRTKSQVARELPQRVEQTLLVELEPAQRRVYDELRDHYRRALLPAVRARGMGRARMQVLEALLRLRQAACHPALIDRTATHAPSAKLDMLLPMLAEVIGEGHKALVFSQFTSFLALLRARLDAAGIAHEYLDGGTDDREARVDHFQREDGPPVFLISLRAGGQGLNLTAADYVYLLDPWWNPAVEAQAIDRAHRIGQRRQVIATRLVAHDTVEEKILELQGAKRELADAILQENEGKLAGIGEEELALLLS